MSPIWSGKFYSDCFSYDILLSYVVWCKLWKGKSWYSFVDLRKTFFHNFLVWDKKNEILRQKNIVRTTSHMKPSYTVISQISDGFWIMMSKIEMFICWDIGNIKVTICFVYLQGLFLKIDQFHNIQLGTVYRSVRARHEINCLNPYDLNLAYSFLVLFLCNFF